MQRQSSRVLTIRTAGHRYAVHVGQNILDQLDSFLTGKITGTRCAIISDEAVARHFADRVQQRLTAAQIQPILIVIPSGEQSKTLERVNSICDQMIAAGLDRQSFVVGLGGGVIGDISGLVAALYHRGIPHVQIPTTLLAMVDSSIGGKTGVNAAAAKNLIGAVHHPALVVDDIDLLKTLPPREFKQGFAEIVKHAIVADAEMFRELQKDLPQILHLHAEKAISRKLAPLICRNIKIKARVVATDDLDRTGARAVLNFGHTVGHAIERAGGYDEFRHGESISLGLVAACTVSMKKAGLAAEQRTAAIDLLQSCDLPTSLPADFRREKIFEALPFDKKFSDGKIRFVLTPAIGSAHLSADVTMEDIREAIEAL